MKTRIRFITDIFKIADKMNKTDDGMELLMLIDDAEKMYDKQFSDLLSEQQQPTEPNNKFDTKQLIIGDVSKQRELLIAFMGREWHEDEIMNSDEEIVDMYLKKQ